MPALEITIRVLNPKTSSSAAVPQLSRCRARAARVKFLRVISARTVMSASLIPRYDGPRRLIAAFHEREFPFSKRISSILTFHPNDCSFVKLRSVVVKWIYVEQSVHGACSNDRIHIYDHFSLSVSLSFFLIFLSFSFFFSFLLSFSLWYIYIYIVSFSLFLFYVILVKLLFRGSTSDDFHWYIL